MINFFNKKQISGFTLIELLVATTIFTVVAVGGLSILLSSQRVYRRISSNRIAVDNINLLLDTITREIKFGVKYGCVNDSVQGSFNREDNVYYYSFPESILNNSSLGTCNAVAYTPQGTSTLKVVYYYNQASSTVSQVSYNKIGSNFYKIDSSDLALTINSFNINRFWFIVTGVNDDEYFQPKVEIYVSGVIDTTKNTQGEIVATNTIFLESSITQRSLDN